MPGDRPRSAARRVRGRVRSTVVGSTVVGLGTVGLLAATADAARADVGRPSGIAVSAVSSSAFTVRLNAAASATSYELYASTVATDVYYANIVAGVHTSARHTVTAASPSLTLSGLGYTTGLYYYRVVTINGASRHYSDIYHLGLKPATPTGLVAHTSARGTYLTWHAGAATGFVISQATNAAQTAGHRDWTISSQTHQFTPYKLVKGATYYFRVRADNHGTAGAYSSGYTAVRAANAEQIVRAMTFNILQMTTDGDREGGQTVAPWAKRRLAAAALVKRVDPDVIGVQEGWPLVSPHARQVDSLVSALGSAYTLARTEKSPGEAGYGPHGSYIVYKPSVYRAVGAGGVWSLGDRRSAAYQVLQNRSTGAEFLFTSSHLMYELDAASYDTAREVETRSLVAQARAVAAAHGNVPIVYAGDFNSDTSGHHSFDGAGLAMAALDNADGQLVAQSYTDRHYNSANGYERTPPQSDQDIDKIYTEPGTAIYSWRLLLDLDSDGQFAGTIPSDHNPLYSTIVIPY